MNEQALSPVSQSFAGHVQAFHGSLPVEEQHLLEKVFVLAEWAAGRSDVQGHALNAYLKIDAPGTSPALNFTTLNFNSLLQGGVHAVKID